MHESEESEYFPKILKAVHLPVVKPVFLNQIEKKVEHSEEAKDLIEEAKKSVDVKETREWYLPRYKSSGPLTLERHSVRLNVHGKEYEHYSRCALIKGLPGTFMANVNIDIILSNSFWKVPSLSRTLTCNIPYWLEQRRILVRTSIARAKLKKGVWRQVQRSKL